MSSQQQKKGSSNQFCKVCFDSGKSFTKYSSHNVRNSGGDVICPTLLNQMCKYCKKQGHTPSHCPDLKGKYNKQKQAEQVQSKQVQSKQAVQKQAEQVQSKQAVQKQAVQKQAVQVQALQKRAARLCESPPPPPCLNSFGNKMDSTEEKKIVRPIATKQNCWAKNSSAKNSWANVVMRSCNERAPSPETEEEQEQADQAPESEEEQDQAQTSVVAEQDQAEQDQAEQDQAEQEQASESEEQEEQAPESEEEQEQTSVVVVAEQEQKPTVNKYVPTSYSSWADAD